MRKGDDVFRVQRISNFHNKKAAAYVKRAIQQEAEEREDYVEAIQKWEDLGGDDLVMSGDDDYGADADKDAASDLEDADPMEIDSPDERRRQIDGFRAEIANHALDLNRAESVLGRGVLANFDPALEPLSPVAGSAPGHIPPNIPEAAKFPEFTQIGKETRIGRSWSG